MLALSTRCEPEGIAATGSQLPSANVVVSSDSFKTFIAGVRSCFGGRLRGCETLLEPAAAGQPGAASSLRPPAQPPDRSAGRQGAGAWPVNTRPATPSTRA
ncbi:MAG: hypothetical protein ACOVN7_16860 [Rubrivivax sp.]